MQKLFGVNLVLVDLSLLKFSELRGDVFRGRADGRPTTDGWRTDDHAMAATLLWGSAKQSYHTCIYYCNVYFEVLMKRWTFRFTQNCFGKISNAVGMVETVQPR